MSALLTLAAMALVFVAIDRWDARRVRRQDIEESDGWDAFYRGDWRVR